MNRLIAIGVMSATLAACTGGGTTSSSTTDASSDAVVASSIPAPLSSSSVSSSAPESSSSSSIAPPPPSSSSVASSSIAPPPSSSSVASSSEPTSTTGNAARGAELIVLNKMNCIGCHGNDYPSHGYVNGPVGLIDADQLGSRVGGPAYDGTSEVAVAEYIKESMFSIANVVVSDECTDIDQCALDMAAYLIQLGDGIPNEPTTDQFACTLEDSDVRYGPRSLRILNKYEYDNSVAALFNESLPRQFSNTLSDDEIVRGFPVNLTRSVNNNALDNFDRNAGELAKWAVANPSALGFDCSDPSACADALVNDFAYRAFRRPLTEDEAADYKSVILNAEPASVGLEWALRSVLSSPHFLYRSELGMAVADAITTPLVQPPAKAAFEGEPTTIRDLQVLRYESISIGASTQDEANHTWSGKGLLAISIKSKKSSLGNWPVLVVQARANNNTTEIAEINVNHAGARTYEFEVDIPEGGSIILWHNANANGDYTAEPVEIVSLKAGIPGEPEPVVDYRERFKVADESAYVLSPYEYASALSFFLTGSSPDSELLEIAGNGTIFDESVLESEVERMINSNLGRAQVERFAGMWYGTDAVVDVNRMGEDTFTQDVRDSMAQEIREIFKAVFFENRDFLDVYRGEFTMLDSTLSDFYGITGGGGSHMDFAEVNTTDFNRGGVFASGAFMARFANSDDSSPIKRSVHFRQEILCQDIPAPDSLGADELDRTVKVQSANEKRDTAAHTEAQYYAEVTSPAACDVCHKAIINPLFAAADFDRFGRTYQRDGDMITQIAMTYQTDATDENGEVLIDDLGNVVRVSVFGEDLVDAKLINEGGYLYGAYEVGTVGNKADADLAAGRGLFFKGAKDLSAKAAEARLPGLEACLVDRASRLALGSTIDVRLSDSVAPWSADRIESSNCVKSDVVGAYELGGKSAYEVFKALALSDALLFRR